MLRSPRRQPSSTGYAYTTSQFPCLRHQGDITRGSPHNRDAHQRVCDLHGIGTEQTARNGCSDACWTSNMILALAPTVLERRGQRGVAKIICSLEGSLVPWSFVPVQVNENAWPTSDSATVKVAMPVRSLTNRRPMAG